MPVVTVYRLTFSSGLHVGTRGVNLEESSVSIPSDTLFAALVDTYRRTGGDPGAFVAPFPREDVPGNPPFLLTSGFPFAGEVRFFPVPIPLQRIFREETLKNRRKDIQKIRYLSESLWRRMADGECLDDWLFPEDEHVEPETGVALQGKTLWLTLEECKALPDQFQRNLKTRQPISRRALREHKVYMDSRVPRVTVDRIGLASNIFHAGRVAFAPDCGLWFGVEWRVPQAVVGGTPYEEAFRQTLALLRDDGLGGERTSGYGAFTYEEKGPLTLPNVQPGGPALLLSRYHPKTEELPDVLSGEKSAYALTAVAGWLRSWDGAAQRRKRLWLVEEGSVVRAVSDGPWGDVVDVRPDYASEAENSRLPHPVWRYGLALPVGLKEA